MTQDRILIEGIQLYGYHGVNASEREQGQRFVVDLVLNLDLAPAGVSDDLSLTVNYAAVFKVVRASVEGEPCNLIEAVAERVAARLISEFPLEEVTVTVRKPWAPVKGSVLSDVAVQITRRPSPSTI